MTTFLTALAVPTQRAQLVEIVRKAIGGEYTGDCFACDLRAASIHLTDEQLIEAINAVQLRDDVADGAVHWSQLIPEAAGDDLPGQALEAAEAALDATLTALLPTSPKENTTP